MYSNRRSVSLPMHEPKTNATQGSYRPRFFDLSEFEVKEVNINSYFYNESDVERELLIGNHSFCYLRDSKLRTIDIVTARERVLSFDEFLKYFQIKVRSNNLFKTGKYLSRVFRPAKFGCFYKNLDIHINSNPAYEGKITDGISLISLNLAKSLGWIEATVNSSAQLTLFFADGLVKGNCVVSDSIEHDIVIYGRDNIKDEISLGNQLIYVALEPLKLGKKLRMDIQTLLNLWPIFGADQYLSWAIKGIEQFKSDLLNGKLNEWLDDFDLIKPSDHEKESWVLQKAIWHQIDYRHYPGLFRSAWRMFKNSMLRFADDKKGQPAFRIYVPEGKRGYLRVDLRNHDSDGNFIPLVKENEVSLDELGNLWTHPNDIERLCSIHGGADQDDSFAVIQIADGKALLYRNPNQYGEVSIYTNATNNTITHNDRTENTYVQVIGSLPEKVIPPKKTVEEMPITKNNLIQKHLAPINKSLSFLEYTIGNLLKTYTRITGNKANIGIAANAEMIKAAVKITAPEKFEFMFASFNYDLENIIDSTVKTGIDCSQDMAAVRSVFNYVANEQIEMPSALVNRIPESIRELILTSNNHPLDELLAAIRYFIDKADVDIIGKGAVSHGNRVKGFIDNLNIPIVDIGIANLSNQMNDYALNLSKKYNRSIAITLNRAEDLGLDEKEIFIKDEIDRIQTELLGALTPFTVFERIEIIKAIAYNIYKSDNSIHDSILWIADKDNIRGTATDMFEMLASIKQAAHIKRNGSLARFLGKTDTRPNVKSVRVWSKEILKAESFAGVSHLLIENKTVLLNNEVLNLGDECNQCDGVYSIKYISQSISRKSGQQLRNSLTLILV